MRAVRVAILASGNCQEHFILARQTKVRRTLTDSFSKFCLFHDFPLFLAVGFGFGGFAEDFTNHCAVFLGERGIEIKFDGFVEIFVRGSKILLFVEC
jgi:hypothetical protein